jgi:hypothetical protein
MVKIASYSQEPVHYALNSFFTAEGWLTGIARDGATSGCSQG